MMVAKRRKLLDYLKRTEEERYKAILWRPEEKVELPAGVEPIVVEGADWTEAMFFLEPHRALVVGDLLAGTGDSGRSKATVR